MENYKQHIGKEISFDSFGFTVSISEFNKFIKPAIIALGETYTALNIGAFNDETFRKLMSHDGIKQAQEQYTKLMDADIAGLKLSTLALKNQLLAEIPDIINDLRLKKEAVTRAYASAQNYENRTIYLKESHVSIVDGKPVVDEIALHKAASIYIETDMQAETYQMLNEFKEKAEQLNAFFKKNGVHSPNNDLRSMLLHDGCFFVDDSGGLAIKPYACKLVENSLFRRNRSNAENQRMIDSRKQQEEEQGLRNNHRSPSGYLQLQKYTL